MVSIDNNTGSKMRIDLQPARHAGSSVHGIHNRVCANVAVPISKLNAYDLKVVNVLEVLA